jgi:signal transduction histidine kinase
VLAEDHAGELGPEAQGYLGRIRKASQRMSALIDGLLELSRLNRSELRRQRLDVSELAGTIVEELREAEPGRQVEVVIADGLSAYGDRNLVRGLLANLIGNAWKFSAGHETARIEVGALNDEAAAEKGGEGGAAGETVIFVADDGVGFDMAYADKLFSPFQRLHSPEEFEGTGIGLATAARIVHRHGGRVWAESVVGRGATFFFTLPRGAVDDSSGAGS